ncbi:hypothetical protein RV12_GL001823 [Enterococcus quebecensis]|nr:hypothetical protein RV12_GL001823 [Enterococcus quebecensis]
MKDTDSFTKEIKRVMDLIMQGDNSLEERLAYYEDGTNYC